MPEELDKQTLIALLREQIAQGSVQMEFPKRYWVVWFDENAPGPEIRAFDNKEELSTLLIEKLACEGGYLFVFYGARCPLSIGATPVLFTPSGALPLFSVDAPVIAEDGYTKITPAQPEAEADPPAAEGT